MFRSSLTRFLLYHVELVSPSASPRLRDSHRTNTPSLDSLKRAREVLETPLALRLDVLAGPARNKSYTTDPGVTQVSHEPPPCMPSHQPCYLTHHVYKRCPEPNMGADKQACCRLELLLGATPQSTVALFTSTQHEPYRNHHSAICISCIMQSSQVMRSVQVHCIADMLLLVA